MVNDLRVKALITQIITEPIPDEFKQVLLDTWLRAGYIIMGMAMSGDGQGLIEFDAYLMHLTKMKLQAMVEKENKKPDDEPIH